MKLEPGKTYVADDGSIHGPMRGLSGKYVEGRVGYCDPVWNNDGTPRFHTTVTLIREYTPDAPDVHHPTRDHRIAYMAAIAGGADYEQAAKIADALEDTVT